MLRFLMILLLVAAGGAQAGQVYRWVDGAGRVHYTDLPPPPDSRQVRTLGGRGNVVEVAKESFAARQARERHPVTLFAGDCGPLCDQARQLLQQRGIPFTHQEPQRQPEAAGALIRLTGALELPVIVIGNTHLKGFEADTWHRLLDVAGYPRTPLIPPAPEQARR